MEDAVAAGVRGRGAVAEQARVILPHLRVETVPHAAIDPIGQRRGARGGLLGRIARTDHQVEHRVPIGDRISVAVQIGLAGLPEIPQVVPLQEGEQRRQPCGDNHRRLPARISAHNV